MSLKHFLFFSKTQLNLKLLFFWPVPSFTKMEPEFHGLTKDSLAMPKSLL